MVNGFLITVHFEPVINPITDADEGNNKQAAEENCIHFRRKKSGYLR